MRQEPFDATGVDIPNPFEVCEEDMRRTFMHTVEISAHREEEEPWRVHRLWKAVMALQAVSPHRLKSVERLHDHKGNLFVKVADVHSEDDVCIALGVIWETLDSTSDVELIEDYTGILPDHPLKVVVLLEDV